MNEKLGSIDETADTGADRVKSFNRNDQVSGRHQTDMLSDNWLSKNARPIALFWVLGLFTLLIILECFGLKVSKESQYATFGAVSIALTFYFGGRSIEKYKRASVKLGEEIASREEKTKNREERKETLDGKN